MVHIRQHSRPTKRAHRSASRIAPLPTLAEARIARLRYARGVWKVIRQILVLLWKVARLVLWRWLKLRLTRMLLVTAALVGVIVFVAVVLGRL
jgi:hypothetical protein